METAMETQTLQRVKTYDGVLRSLHMVIGLALLVLILTGSVVDYFAHGVARDAIWQLHIYAGYSLILGFLARISWGIVGPRHARWSDMWHPTAWLAALRQRKLHAAPRVGHHALASAAYLAVYGVLLMMAVTGLMLAAVAQSTGPLFAWIGSAAWLEDIVKQPHELGYYFLIGFTLLHIFMLIWHEIRGRQPIAQSMVSGYQYLPLAPEEK
jgi:Ni,Fe-hydrogenase I cytochrome b subunit